MSNDPPRPDELPELLEALNYERWMADECARKVRFSVPANAVESNVWLEAYIIHARVLTEFFRDKPKKDDIVAKHYVDTNWKDDEATAALEALTERVEEWHKWLAHLTATRVRNPKPSQDITAIDADLHILYRRFTEALAERASEAR